MFIALLLYGGEAAVMIGALAGVCSALRISRKVRTVAFGSAALACAVFATATVLKFAFGSTTRLLNNGASLAIIALCLMGLVQYLVHTGIGATASALKANESIWRDVEPQLPLDVDQLFRGRCGRRIHRQQSRHGSLLGVSRLHSDHHHRLLQLRPLHARGKSFRAPR